MSVGLDHLMLLPGLRGVEGHGYRKWYTETSKRKISPSHIKGCGTETQTGTLTEQTDCLTQSRLESGLSGV